MWAPTLRSAVGGNTGSWYPGGDSGGSGNPTFPNNWTVQYVDVASTSTTVADGLAGFLYGFGSKDGYANPQGLTTPANTAVVHGRPRRWPWWASGAWCSFCSTERSARPSWATPSRSRPPTPGCFSDAGTTTWTFGTSVGIVQQAVTLTVPTLVWCSVNFPV